MMDDEPFWSTWQDYQKLLLTGGVKKPLCLEKFQLQPRQPPISASVQHQKSKLEQCSLSARLDGDSSDPASHTTPGLQICANTRFCKKPGGSIGSSGSVCRIPPCQSCPHVPTSTAFCCCRMFQEPPPLSRQTEPYTETMSQ